MRNTPCTTPTLQVYWSWRTPASSCTPGLALGGNLQGCSFHLVPNSMGFHHGQILIETGKGSFLYCQAKEIMTGPSRSLILRIILDYH